MALTAMLGALASVGACGSTSGVDGIPAGTGPRCEPGATRACVGAAQCGGGQLCDRTGHWGLCDCGGSPAGGSGGRTSFDSGPPVGTGGTPFGAGGTPLSTGGAAGTPGSGGVGTTGTPIGRACLASADCGMPGVGCLPSVSTVFSGGGPANGMCVADCSADSTVCTRIDPKAVCVSFTSTGGQAYCVEGCTVGPTSAGATKCHQRQDTACDDSPGLGFCRPICRGDFDCGNRKCDLGTGFCMDAIPGTLPVGGGCDPTRIPDACRGSCIPLDPTTPTAGMCAGFCSLGGIGCGENPSSTAPPDAACLFDGTTAGGGDLGDVGLCGALCDCDAQCTAAGRVCVPIPVAQQSMFGRAGYCGGANDPQGVPHAHIPTCPPKP